MHVEFLHQWSEQLGHDMYINRYGHAGVPIVVFPSQGGKHTEFADFGMVEAARHFVESGKVQFFTLSSNDEDTWVANDKHPNDMAKAYNAFDRYVIHEAIPLIKHKSGWNDPMMVSGCSMGAYHAINFFLHHPDVFRGVIALSGIYDARFFIGEYGDNEAVYLNSPAEYLWNLEDSWYLDQYRQSRIIIATGHGNWEEPGLPSFYNLKNAFAEKDIPAWFDEWGDDVAHDWEWWRVQYPYFLNQIFG